MEPSEDCLLLREVVDGDEIVVRALHEPFWDPENRRGTPSAFGNGNLISVSRTSVLSESEIIQILKQDLETPDRCIKAIAQVSVEKIILCGSSKDDADQGVFLSVVKDPTENNVAHAEIMGTDGDRRRLKKISRGVGNKILQACSIKELP